MASMHISYKNDGSNFRQHTHKEIDEVVVKAKMQHTNAMSSTYIPTMKQRQSAQNAIDLLQQLALPQININLMDNAVTTTSGQSVTIYINYIPASAEEMEGILTSDVRRVEYLDFPADPRFREVSMSLIS